MQTLKNFMDEKGRVVAWPAKKQMKLEVIEYMAEKFEEGITYTEKEVNEIIDLWHTFGDYFMLRRGMVDYGLLERTRNGAEYWKKERC